MIDRNKYVLHSLLLATYIAHLVATYSVHLIATSLAPKRFQTNDSNLYCSLVATYTVNLVVTF